MAKRGRARPGLRRPRQGNPKEAAAIINVFLTDCGTGEGERMHMTQADHEICFVYIAIHIIHIGKGLNQDTCEIIYFEKEKKNKVKSFTNFPFRTQARAIRDDAVESAASSGTAYAACSIGIRSSSR